MALDDYRGAQRAFKTALRLNAADSNAATRLELVEQVLELDPTLRGLSAAERYRRSQKVMEAPWACWMSASEPGQARHLPR